VVTAEPNRSLLQLLNSTNASAVDLEALSLITNQLISAGFAGSFAGYFKTGDPNAHQFAAADVASVPKLNKAAGAQTAALDTEKLVITTEGFEVANVGLLAKRCTFWKSIAGEIRI
jgi:hypothetical protein